MKKLEIEYRPLIYTMMIYLMLWIRFRKELMLVYVKNFLCLLMMSIVIAVCRCNYNLKDKYDNFFLLLKVVFIYCIVRLVMASFSMQPHLVFVFHQFEVSSDKKTLELSNSILLSKAKLNHVNTKATRVYLFVKKTNI